MQGGVEVAIKSIGFIETFGLAACVAAADAAVKSANVKLLGYEYAKGGGMCTVKVEGNVGACRAAVAAGKKAADAVTGTLGGTKSTLMKGRPAEQMLERMVYNRETVGGDIALAEGYRPKGESRVPVLVKNWKPKEEPKEETPIEETPETPVEEDSKEEAEEADADSPEPPVEVVEEPVIEAEAEESVEEAVVEETVVAPETEEAPEAPTVEIVETPVVEEPAEVVAPEPEAKVEEAAEPAKAEASEAETPKKSTSTGKRRSRKKKKTDE
jgi:hypothetical protein